MKNLVALLLTLCVCVSMCACGGNDAKAPANDPQPTTSKVTEPTTEPSTPDDEQGTTQEPEVTGPVGETASNVEYVNTVTESVYYVSTEGFAYRGDNGMYGVKSLDGSFDSGLIYYKAEVKNDYFVVQTKSLEDPEKLDCVNSCGVIDAKGNVIVPAEYALVEAEGDYYFRAYEVSGLTEDSENYLLRLSKNMFSLTADEGDVLYTGQWCVFDLRTGKEVPNMTGTTGVFLYLNGEVLSYTANGEKVRVNADGQSIPANAQMFEDGSYIPQDENAVYGPDFQKRFAFKKKDYSPYSWQNGYYIMHRYKNGEDSYVLADEKGNIISPAFEERIEAIEGGLIGADSGVYDMEGNEILSGNYYNSYYCDGVWIIRDEAKNVYIVDSNYVATLVCQMDDSYTYSINGTHFAITKTVDNDYYYYSVTQKDFVEGTPVAIGVAERTVDEKKVLVDMKTDEVLVSGYSRYIVEMDDQDGKYIYAFTYDEDYNSFYDLFLVK